MEKAVGIISLPVLFFQSKLIFLLGTDIFAKQGLFIKKKEFHFLTNIYLKIKTNILMKKLAI